MRPSSLAGSTKRSTWLYIWVNNLCVVCVEGREGRLVERGGKEREREHTYLVPPHGILQTSETVRI